MFKGHPKGLYVLFFSNMGERFGYYTMLAIFTLFLQDHFGWDETRAAGLYGIFLAAIYFAPMLGGIIADAWLGYGKTVTIGIITMGAGYALLSQTGADPTSMYIALAIIALGVGFFKGNLVVIVGNLYENSKIGHLRDSAFNIFYMGINIGAMFAPHVARYLKNLMMSHEGFTYNSAIPKIANDVIAGNPVTSENLQKIQQMAGTTDMASLTSFAHNYLNALAHGYNWGFAAAGISMLISIVIFIAFKKYYKEADYMQKDKIKTGSDVELTPKQTRDRILALLLVFVIVIFFWMAFHQNGSTLTFFAKNYTNLSASKFTFLLFNIPSLLAIFAVILGAVAIFNKASKAKFKALGAGFVVAGAAYLVYMLKVTSGDKIAPELFQSFNPMFVVFLTPVVVGFFLWLHNKHTEPSAPSKIGIGMVITAIGFAIMMYASYTLPSVKELGGNAIDQSMAVSPYWLISTYFTLTVAELFLSPMGLSFVSKVAPPKLRGTMQAGWLSATAIGNYLAGYIGRFYKNWELWQFFLLLVVVAALSAIIMFSIMHIIKRAATS
ncbi:MAG TPA: peptide MFS transporter [Bacteroidales bacterium]|nr:peptide MFS transporter [Bacteroidales bacterium]